MRASTHPFTTEALIIRENNNVGEADRFVTALTAQRGVIRASARGAQKTKSRNAAATRLLCYSQLSLVPSRDKFIIEEARPVHVFFELRESIEKLALAQYFCELAGLIVPQEEPAEPQLRLLCEALYRLCRDDRPLPLVKAAVELRLLSLCGFMPDLTGCARCHEADKSELWFSPERGQLVCGDCGMIAGSVALSPGVLRAARHIVYGAADKVFAFSLGEDSLRTLADVSERYLLCQLGRGFRTLDFYHSL